MTIAALVAGARAASAAELTLVWDAPAECPAGADVERRLLQRLGSQRKRFALKATATVRREADLFRVRLETHRNGQRGVRQLEAPTCDALVEAIAVILALAVDPEPAPSPDTASHAEADTGESTAGAEPANAQAEARAGEGGEAFDEGTEVHPAPGRVELSPAPSSSEDPSKKKAAGDEAATEPEARPFTDLGLQGIASFAGSVESGVLPGLGFGITLRGGARLRRFRLEAALSRWFSRQATGTEPGRGAHVDGLSAAVFTCFRAVPAHTAAVPRLRSALPPDDSPAIEAGPCLGVELGHVRARSFGVAEPGDGGAAYAGVGGALRLGATASEWLSLDVRFEAFRLLQAPEFRVENLGVVHTPASWSLRAALGAEAYFP